MNISINPKTGIIAISFFIMLLSLILLIHSPGVLAQDLNNTSFDSNDLLHIENDEKSLTTKFEVIGSDPEVVFHKPKQEEEPKLSSQSFEVEANITVLNVLSYPTAGGNVTQNTQASSIDWTDWDCYRAVLINNTGGSELTYYQLNVSLGDGINETSLRVVNMTVNTIIPHWCETVIDGNCTKLWFNTTHIPANSWCNDTYRIYYGNDTVSSTSDYNATFTKSYNTTGLIIDLHMDEGSGLIAYDATGNHDGEFRGGMTTDDWMSYDGGFWDSRTDLVFNGSCIEFDGTYNRVDCGDGSDIPKSGSFTVCCWAKPDVAGNKWAAITDSYHSNANVTLPIYTADNNTFSFTTASGSWTNLHTDGFSADTWYFIAATWDVSTHTKRVYLNGLINGTQIPEPSGYPYGSCTNFTVGGRRNGDAGVAFDGWVDEVKVYNRTLSGDEVWRMYIRSKYAANAPTAALDAEENISNYIPPNPKNIQNTSGNLRVNHTWEAGTGNVTNSYNVSVNGVWHNATTDNFWNDTYTAHAWQNITVYAYNTSGVGTLSTGSISQNTQISAPTWLSGWLYRMPIEINNTGNVLTYYQYNFTVDSASLVAAGKMNANGSDCRITSDDNYTLQPFWNETSWNNSSTMIWVNASTLVNVTNTTHYMYYGNSMANDISNGNNTFDFFDNFEDLVGWSDVLFFSGNNYSTSTIVNNHLHIAVITNDNRVGACTDCGVLSQGQRIEAKVDSRIATADINTELYHSYGNLYENDPCVGSTPDYEVWGMIGGNGFNIYDTANADDVPTYPYIEYRSNDHLHFGSRELPNRISVDSNWDDYNYRWGVYSNHIGTLDVDWVFVRQFNATEPSMSIGSEERETGTTPNPTNLLNTTGNNWVNYTWTADAGNITDSYNVSQNGTWDNTSSNTYRNDTISAGSYSEIIIYAYNNTNGLSSGYLSDNVSVSAIAIINSFTPNATLEIQDEQGANYKQSYPYLQKSRTLNTSATLSSTDGVGGVRFIVDQGETGETIVNDINTADTFFSAQFFGLSYGNHTLDIIILNTSLVPLSGPDQTESIDPFWIVPYIIQFVGDSITISLADDTTCDVLNLADATGGCNAVTSENLLELPCWDNDAVESFRDYSNGIHIFYSDYAKSIYGTYVFGNNEAESGITAGGTHTKFQNNNNGYADRFASLDENGSNAGLFGPTHAYVMLGLNDKRTGVTEDTYETQLSNVVNDIHNKGLPYENITLLYPTYWHTYDVSNYLDNIDNVANNLGTRLIKDLYNETKDNYYNGGESWYSGDNVHFTRAGSKNISRIIAEQSTWLLTEQANYTEYSGSETTDFNNISDITNVSDATLQTNTAKITWYNNVNAYEANFDINVDFGFAFVNVNASGLNSTFNSSANVTFYNLSWSETPVIFEDGSPSQDCAINFYSGGNLSFNVTHFTNYSAGANANLTIWDDTDPEGGSQTKYSRDQIKFYANYTNRTSGQPINETGVYCNISFNVTPNGPFGMTFNSSSLLYEYNRSFPTSGTFNWNVTGNGSVQDYEVLNVTDIVTVIISTSNNYIPPDPTNLVNSTGNFWVNHTWEAGTGNVTNSYNVSLNGVWHNATADNFWNDTYTAHAWQNITIYTYNTSGTGTLSSGNISQDAQIPNNPVTITNTSGWSGDAGANVYVDYDATDADSDIPIFSCNRTDLFADFHTSTGTGNWTAASGTHVVDFGVSDGYG
ncbi:Lysophospholipase L1, partial [Candidatus Methanomarinus sp.]